MLRNRPLVTLLCSTLVLVSCSGGLGSSKALEAAETFRDPQGFYVIDIDPTWDRRTDVPSPSVEVWSMGEAVDEFQSNVNILRDAPGGRDLVQYMEYSADNLGSLTLVGKAVVKGQFGNELGVFEYTGRVPQADRSLHFLAIVMVTSDHAIVATLTAVESAFADIRKEVEPFMRTLRPPQVS